MGNAKPVSRSKSEEALQLPRRVEAQALDTAAQGALNIGGSVVNEQGAVAVQAEMVQPLRHLQEESQV